MLPPYCYAKTSANATEAQKQQWITTFGRKNYGHIHHYCSVLHALNQANMAPTKEARIRLLKTTFYGFDYMQRLAEPDFVLQPEISYKKGKVLWELGQTGEAIKEFQKSIRQNADYLPPYRALADLFIELNMYDDARHIIEAGLTISPDSASLNRRLRKLEKAQNP